MDEDRLEEMLYEFGKVIQELVYLSETDPESPAAEQRADEIKARLMETLTRLEPAKCYILVRLERTDEIKERVREKNLTDFFWGLNRFNAEITVRIRRHGLGTSEVVCDPIRLVLNPEDLCEEHQEQADQDSPSAGDIREINSENLEHMFEVLGFGEDISDDKGDTDWDSWMKSL